MALDEEEVNKILAAARVSSTCPTPLSLAQQTAALSQTFEIISQSYMTEINNLITLVGAGGDKSAILVIRALVNEVGNIIGSDTSFAFDGATDIFTYDGLASGVTSGTALNIQARAFLNNEPVNLTSYDGGVTWMAEKLATNIVKALVNEAGNVTTGDPEFDFDTGTAITGFAATSGTAYNEPPATYTNNEIVHLILADDGSWRVMQDDDDSGGGGGGTTYFAGYGLGLDGGDTFRLGNNHYDGGEFELPGSLDDGTFYWDSIGGWTKRLPDWDDAKLIFIVNEEDDDPKWKEPADFSDGEEQYLGKGTDNKFKWFDSPTSDATCALTTSAISAASGDTPGTGTVTLKVFNGATYDSDGSADAINPTEMPIASGVRVGGKVLPGGKFEIAWSDYRHGIPGFTLGNDQSIGHDAAGELEHQDDGECE